ncbi:MAG: HEAT repeat domain-containing protein [Myxococcales bacterium]|nr:HEAT repeat domain-containing protein [Myxococcales bacterium]
MARPITLPAALRDVADAKPLVRNIAIRHLGGLLLDAIGTDRPRWDAAALHEHGPAVRDALRRCAQGDPDQGVRALAATGLGQIGDVALVELVTPWIESTADDLDATFSRECGLIAISLLGEAARESAAAPELAESLARTLARALVSPSPDARFQAAQGLVSVLGARAEPDLVRALEAEQDPRVRAGIASAIAELDPPGAAACTALRPYLHADDRTPAGRELASRPRSRSQPPATLRAVRRSCVRSRIESIGSARSRPSRRSAPTPRARPRSSCARSPSAGGSPASRACGPPTRSRASSPRAASRCSAASSAACSPACARPWPTRVAGSRSSTPTPAGEPATPTRYRMSKWTY